MLPTDTKDPHKYFGGEKGMPIKHINEQAIVENEFTVLGKN